MATVALTGKRRCAGGDRRQSSMVTTS